jgi:DNA-binding IclR family transcriptional regulator
MPGFARRRRVIGGRIDKQENGAMVEERRERRIQSIEVGFLLIRVLEAADGPLPLRTLAARAEMPPSKAYTYLVSFAREGLVMQDPVTGQYGLGPFAFQLGLSAIRQVDVIAIASGEMAELCRTTHFACTLCVWGNRGPVIAVKSDGQGQGALAVRVGYVLPLRTAVGYAFLAWMDQEEVNEVATEQKIYDDPEIEADLRNVKKNGYAVTPATLPTMIEGFSGIASPIFDHSGQVTATLSYLGPTKLLRKKGPHVQQLVEAAARLSAKIGGAHPPALSIAPVAEQAKKRPAAKVQKRKA